MFVQEKLRPGCCHLCTIPQSQQGDSQASRTRPPLQKSGEEAVDDGDKERLEIEKETWTRGVTKRRTDLKFGMPEFVFFVTAKDDGFHIACAIDTLR